MNFDKIFGSLKFQKFQKFQKSQAEIAADFEKRRFGKPKKNEDLLRNRQPTD